MNITYIVLRLIRHFLPEPFLQFILQRQIIIKPGYETRLPLQAAENYLRSLRDNKTNIENKDILIFGYGGNLHIACLLLEAGAKKIVLLEQESFPNKKIARGLFEQFPQYFSKSDGHICEDEKFMQIIHANITEIAGTAQLMPVDIVLSASVFEHLTDVESVTQALAVATKKGGLNLHFIDLRDHFFRFPFEMLRFSESAWIRWLNPSSNLNRYRSWQYKKIFQKYFSKAQVIVDARDEENFSKMESNIRPEFLSGDRQVDSITNIHVLATK